MFHKYYRRRRWTRSSTWILNFRSLEPILLRVNVYVTHCSPTRSSKMFLYRTHNDNHKRLRFMFLNVLVTTAQSCSWSVGVSSSPSRSVICCVFVNHPVGILSKHFLQFSLRIFSRKFLCAFLISPVLKVQPVYSIYLLCLFFLRFFPDWGFSLLFPQL